MRIHYRVFSCPKQGNTADEYEDAFWPPHGRDGEQPLFRLAVADGATESSFAGRWAALLVRAYCRGRLLPLGAALGPIQRVWQREIESRPLPWYAEEKARAGAFSSVVGLTVRAGEWQAVAVGDSCLFHLRGTCLLCAFPLECSNAFTQRPALLASVAGRNGFLRQGVPTISGQWEPGDRFLLATDALACWLLRRWENGEVIDLPESGDALQAMIARARRAALRNDDVTLTSLTVY